MIRLLWSKLQGSPSWQNNSVLRNESQSRAQIHFHVSLMCLMNVKCVSISSPVLHSNRKPWIQWIRSLSSLMLFLKFVLHCHCFLLIKLKKPLSWNESVSSFKDVVFGLKLNYSWESKDANALLAQTRAGWGCADPGVCNMICYGIQININVPSEKMD